MKIEGRESRLVVHRDLLRARIKLGGWAVVLKWDALPYYPTEVVVALGRHTWVLTVKHERSTGL